MKLFAGLGREAVLGPHQLCRCTLQESGLKWSSTDHPNRLGEGTGHRPEEEVLEGTPRGQQDPFLQDSGHLVLGRWGGPENSLGTGGSIPGTHTDVDASAGC